ncbi:MAG: 5-formyltetrahydrofolate cyclo-ligase [Desulfosarcinaceae bacterium]|jgi:5-formyltetrahydrofolate cyclo-ligase
MEEVREKKQEIRNEVLSIVGGLEDKQRREIQQAIEARLFDFANFLEARIALLYVNTDYQVRTMEIIKRSYDYNKIVVLPVFDTQKFEMTLFKVDNPDKDLIRGSRGILEPDLGRCKSVPIECIDIAIIPGMAMDEKGGRLGSGEGYYDRLIPQLPITTRKVGLLHECQIVPVIPMESHDKHVDIIITEKRIIYKI